MFPWLLLAPDGDILRMKCTMCAKYKQKNVWALEGTPNVQKSSLERHNDSYDHAKAVRLCLQEKSLDTIFDEDLDDATNIETSDPDICLVRTIYSLMKSDIPLEKVNAILELQRLNGLDLQYKNLSWTTNRNSEFNRKHIEEKSRRK